MSKKLPKSGASGPGGPVGRPVAGYPEFRQIFGARIRDLAGASSGSKWPELLVMVGESDFFLSKAATAVSDAWRRRVTGNSADAVVVDSVEASEIAKDGLLDLLLSQGLFEDARLVVVRRAEKRSDFGRLLASLPPANEWTNRLLVTFEKPALTAEFKRQLERLGGELIQVTPPVTASDFQLYVQAALQRARLQLTPEAQHLLLTCCGRDAVLLENEINRIALIFPPIGGLAPHGSTGGAANNAGAVGAIARELGVSDIAPVLGVMREDEVFKLDELLINRRYSAVELLLHQLIQRGESPLAVTGLLARHCRTALIIKDELLNRGSSNIQGLATRLRMPQSVIRNFMRYASGLSEGRFARALGACAQADMDLKTSGLPESLVLSRIVECLQES